MKLHLIGDEGNLRAFRRASQKLRRKITHPNMPRKPKALCLTQGIDGRIKQRAIPRRPVNEQQVHLIHLQKLKAGAHRRQKFRFAQIVEMHLGDNKNIFTHQSRCAHPLAYRFLIVIGLRRIYVAKAATQSHGNTVARNLVLERPCAKANGRNY